MISTYNEWSRLREIVVGTATAANWPITDPVFAMESQRSIWQETPVPQGPVPQWIIDETNEDLQGLVDILQKAGVQVHRPQHMDFQQLDGMYNYCPRDRLLIYGDTIVDVSMLYPCRDQEIQALDYLFSQQHQIMVMPRDQGLICDAANICRLGTSWLFLQSQSGNQAAHEWLCARFPDVNIELCDFYAGVHIDSTIVPLREGLVLLNASRVNSGNCPKIFEDWQKIYVEDVVPQGFYQYPYASKWIALNMLSIDHNTVIMDSAQVDLIRVLDNLGFDVVPHTLRHSRTLGGGFHCVTLDLYRED